MAHDREFQRKRKDTRMPVRDSHGEDQPAARQTEQDFDLRRARDTPSSVNGKTHRQDIPVQTEFSHLSPETPASLLEQGEAYATALDGFSEHFETPDATRTAPPIQDNVRSNFRQEASRRSFVTEDVTDHDIENVASLDALLSSISQERINRELAQEYAAQIRVNEKRVAQTEGFKAKLYENLVSGILTKEEFLSYKRKYNADIELFQKAIAEWNEKLTDVLENRSERNRWINHFMKFSTMEDIDRRAVMQLIRSIRVMGKDELHIEFNYQDEYQKAISLAEQIATKNEERMVG